MFFVTSTIKIIWAFFFQPGHPPEVFVIETPVI
jgi:hypothetical protein